MTDILKILPEEVFRAAGAAVDHSQTITGYLSSIDREVMDLLATWKGESATAYSSAWDDLVEILRKMATDLDTLGFRVSDATGQLVQASSTLT
ncbi:WXG100 family type VII secretion target [Mycobacteroides abscessus subsp. abscessus]|uniref:WXG100 family type VII secretion target n=1 Tax=Mycobacteroides abscessus TaxID=36809 RepID=UPI00266C701C|nr:WXG100 family type VII secretion target [Mycobacteroides abscessus]MDO3166653.1 WXG100 family type VII secretion target [Mycobacteroides abscessus subsp. abscessus]